MEQRIYSSAVLQFGETLRQQEFEVAFHMTFTVQKHRMGMSYQLLSLHYTIQNTYVRSDLPHS